MKDPFDILSSLWLRSLCVCFEHRVIPLSDVNLAQETATFSCSLLSMGKYFSGGVNHTVSSSGIQRERERRGNQNRKILSNFTDY